MGYSSVAISVNGDKTEGRETHKQGPTESDYNH